jgi:hypothetical protein
MGGADVRIRLASFILLLFSSCFGFAQLQVTRFDGLSSVCSPTVIAPNSTMDAGSVQVGGGVGEIFCLENSGASAITVTAITVTGADFSLSPNEMPPIVVQPNPVISPPLVVFVFAPSAAGTRTAQISFVDNASGSPQAFTLSGTGFTDFGLGSARLDNTQTVIAGHTASYPMTILGASIPPGPTAFNGVVSFSCSNLPQGASCAFSPGSVQLQNGMEFMNIGLDVGTTARPVASLHDSGFKLWYSLAAVFALVLGASRSRFKRIGLSVFFMILVFAISCGGGSSSKAPSGPTPAGTFQFIVNGTSNGVTRSKNLVLVVQ